MTAAAVADQDRALSYWPTPAQLGEDLVYWVLEPWHGTGDGVRVLEPSAGTGDLARAVLAAAKEDNTDG